MKTLLLSIFISTISFSSQILAACYKKSHDISNPTEYYSGISDETGEHLKASLNNLIKSHNKYSYTPCVWVILKEADQDDGSNKPDDWNQEHI